MLLQQEKYRKDAVLEKVTMHCSRGPKDHRNVEAHAKEKEPGQRVNRTSIGMSVKVGCTAHYAVRTQPDTPDISEILYYVSEHSQACQVDFRLRSCPSVRHSAW